MSDELSIPQVPDAKPDDPEDVSWALSTAEAMWARGDHSEGIKWVRRAAEAASEAEEDARALELAKAAADLQGLIARMSMPDKGSDRKLPPVATKTAASPSGPVSAIPPTNRSVPPIGRSTGPVPKASSVPAPKTGSPSKPPGAGASRSVPPIGVSTKPSQAPAAPGPATKPSTRPQATSAGRDVRSTPSNRPGAPDAKKKGRRSRENLEAEARAAGLTADTEEVAAVTHEELRKNGYESDSTLIASRADIEKRRKSSARSVEEWDALATANLTGDDLVDDDGGGRRTASRPPKSLPPAIPPRSGTSAAPRATRAPSIVPHDPGIQTTQAVRVTVWKDATGVHVAPAGTVVSAIKIDAVLVALEPTADLTAWLSPKKR